MKPIIEYADFEKLDLRVGLVITVSLPEWSNKLIEMRVDFGTEIGQKTIFAGVRKFVNIEDILNKKFVFIVNLAERKLGEGVSQGMMLVASDDVTHCPLAVSDALAPGSSIR
jgi:methionyl-tRNA synthetase